MECQCSITTSSSVLMLLKQWISRISLHRNIECPTGNLTDDKECSFPAQEILRIYHIALKCLNLPENTIDCYKSKIINYDDIKLPLIKGLLYQGCRSAKFYMESNLGLLLELYLLFNQKGVVQHFWKDKAVEPFSLTLRKYDSEWNATKFRDKVSNEEKFPSKFQESWISASERLPNYCHIANRMVSFIHEILNPKDSKENEYLYVHPQKWSEKAVYLKVTLASAYQRSMNASNYNVVGNCIKKMSIPECAFKIYLCKDEQKCNFYKYLHETGAVDNDRNEDNNSQKYLERVARFKVNMERKEDRVRKKTHSEAIQKTCAQMFTDILDISMEAVEQRGETTYKQVWSRWSSAGEVVTSDWQVGDLISQEREIQEMANRGEEVITRKELKEYMEKTGESKCKYEPVNPREHKNQPILVNIVKNLDLKYTMQERPLKKLPVTTIAVGLQDLQSLKIVYKLLHDRKILPILASTVISSCISNYQHINTRLPREDCVLWACIKKYLSGIETSQMLSREFKNYIKSELEKLLRGKIGEEMNICSNTNSSKENKFAVNTLSKYGIDIVYRKILTENYRKVWTLKSKKPLEYSNLSRRLFHSCSETLTINNESKNGKKEQYGKLAYQSLCLGGNVGDSILVGAILEYAMEMDERWVLINFPETRQQAVFLEEALTGRKEPSKENIQGQVPSSQK